MNPFEAAPGALENLRRRCAVRGIELLLARIPDWSEREAGRRARESHTVREMARAYLASQGVVRAPLPNHPEGFPIWPDGWTGSFSHSAGWGAAVVTRSDAHVSLGVDVEHAERMTRDMAAHVLGPRELTAAPADDSFAQVAAKRFAAKEATFKAVHPVERAVGGFFDWRVDWVDDDGFVAIRESRPGTRPLRIHGGIASWDQLIVAVAWRPAPGCRPAAH
ncbi:MAG: 4'-phosphopantetheinyl transferase superfamily protein [Verrucomicrobia bacterium]|nr:4'-phosphopantetheinyl transferase superfamily protein [Verrucomicrobiota bacterium]